MYKTRKKRYGLWKVSEANQKFGVKNKNGSQMGQLGPQKQHFQGRRKSNNVLTGYTV
jgi:hypothetical protein